MIIDIHVHVQESLDPGLLQAEAERHGVSMVCNLGSSARDGDSFAPLNDRTMELARKRPGFFLGFCRLDPRRPKREVLSEIRRCVANGNLRGVKLSVETNARSRRLDPVMEECARLGVPVLYHAWYKTVGRVPNESTPADIADLARRHPDNRIIMAHLTAAGVRGVLDIRPFPNVLVDTSGSQPFSGIVEYAVEKLGAERILYGSDIPIRDFPCQLGRIHGAEIKPRERDMILGLNAKKLLGL